jgi:DNA end-binding protein Ku
MVVLTDEDLAELPLPTTRSIEVLHFLPAEQLDPILLNRSYFVEPEAAGARAYVLLRDSLERSGKVALALVALRQRESLATLRTRDGLLVLETLLWPDEVRTPDFAFLDDDIEVRSQELKMAASLIESMTVDFEPDEYHDSYREALQELVNAKVEGREVVQPESPAEAAEPTSLADALKASLAAARQAPHQAGEVTAEVKEPRPEIEGGTKARRSGTAKSGGTRAGGRKASESSADESTADESGTGRKRSSASGTRSGTAKGPAKDGQDAAAKEDAAPRSRTRRRAS